MSIHEALLNLELGNARLVAVTKGVDLDRIRESVECGITDIGESYVQEAEEKQRALGKRVCWHLIGRLQSNKVSRAVRIFDVIQSVDSYKLAKSISREAAKLEKIQKIMVQVNISGDKNGVEPERALSLIRKISGLKHIELIGLMAIAGRDNPYVDFKKMRNLFSRTHLKELSMGMSSDYKAAVEAGATMVRIGSAIFGERKSVIAESVSEIFGFMKDLISH